MSLRLGNTDPNLSRMQQQQEAKAKLFFVVEGAETERIYVREFKNLYANKILGEIICLDRIEKDKSNQFYIVTLIDKYFKAICSLDRLIVQKINSLRDEILKEIDVSDSFLQEKLQEIKTIVGEEVFEELFGKIDLKVGVDPLQTLNAIVELESFEKGFDQILIIIDRDRQSFKSQQYDMVLNIAKEQGYKLGISNPCFELFLFLHLNHVNDLDRDALIKNVKKTSKLKYSAYILREEMKKHSKSFKSKSDYDASFIVSQFHNLKENIEVSGIANDPEALKDNIGTSVYEIISPYLE